MTSRTNPNIAHTTPDNLADQFNQNTDFARAKTQHQGNLDTTGMGQEEPNVAKTQADAQAQGPTMTTSSEKTFGEGMGSGSQRTTEVETSIDSTNAGVDHRRSSYSFTGSSLAHASERLNPEE